MLQIHEKHRTSTGARCILGDERNYAGTSFVELEMFGKFQYGSKHLNVSFDPNYQMNLRLTTSTTMVGQLRKCF